MSANAKRDPSIVVRSLMASIAFIIGACQLSGAMAEEVVAAAATSEETQPSVETLVSKPGDAELVSRALRIAADRAAPAVVSVRVTRALPRRDTEAGAAQAGVPDQMGRETLASPYFRPIDFDGSGLVWSEDGEVITSRWNVGKAVDEIAVTLADGRTFPAQLVGFDEVFDLALIRVVGLPAGERLPVLTRRPSPAMPGQFVVAVGRSLGATQTVSSGIISAIGRRPEEDFLGAIQHTARINYGNVGGPLVDAQGQLVGLTVGIHSNPAFNSAGVNSGVGFGVVVGEIFDIVERLRLGEERQRPEPLGQADANTPFVGVGLEAHTSGVGVAVNRVVPGSGADDAGIHDGDVILRFGGIEVHQVPKLQRLIRQRAIDEVVKLEVRRGHEILEIDLKLGRRKE